MKKVSLKDFSFIPASHEDPEDPGVLKKVLFTKKDFPNQGRVQMINWAKVGKGKSPRKLLAFFLFLSILLSGYLYRDSFGSYFFQDDWFSFKISQANSFFDFLAFFIPRTEVIYYRPLGMQIPFFLIKSIFGFNPMPFRIFTFITHGVNTVLVFFLIHLLTKRKSAALLSSFLYSTSATHFIPFYWFATYAFVLGPTAFFLSFIMFLLFLEKRKKSYLIFSWLIFFLGLLVNEIIISLPVVIFLYLFIFKKIKFSSYLLSFLFISLLIFLPRFIFFSPPSEGIYQLSIGRHILINLKTYFFWSFNWSEVLTEQMVRPFIFNKVVVDEYSSYINVTLVTFFILSFIFYLLFLILLKFKLGKGLLRTVIFGIVWFIVGLSPVFLFPLHKYPYYLPISLVGFLLVSVCSLDKMFRIVYRFNKAVLILFLVIILSSWVLATENTFALNSKIHWAPRRAKIAKRLIEKAKNYYRYPFEDYCIYVSKTSENKWALNDQDAFRLLYDDDRIVTIYTEETSGKDVL